jgi:GNAT superfamily N-acetyltransferase
VSAGEVSAPAPLASDHELDAFDSGVAPLDDWLKRRARANEAGGASRTFVVSAGRRVVGHYSLAAGSVVHQGEGLGRALLRDAVLRVLGAAERIGVRAILVHAISADAKLFYERCGFRPSPLDPMTLMITLAEAEQMLAD